MHTLMKTMLDGCPSEHAAREVRLALDPSSSSKACNWLLVVSCEKLVLLLQLLLLQLLLQARLLALHRGLPTTAM